jgi:hypothetical protein
MGNGCVAIEVVREQTDVDKLIHIRNGNFNKDMQLTYQDRIASHQRNIMTLARITTMYTRNCGSRNCVNNANVCYICYIHPCICKYPSPRNRSKAVKYCSYCGCTVMCKTCVGWIPQCWSCIKTSRGW